MIIRIKVTRQENTDYFHCLAGDIVNVDLEDYVAAVVASEIGNAHMDACKAQAIAARTYAMSFVGEDKYLTDKSSSHQAFRASRWDKGKYPNANAATIDTEGLVLTYEGKILKTCSYSSCNGGRTVSSEERWGGYRPYLIAQDDPWDAAACREREEKGYAITPGHGVGMSQYGAAWAAKNGVWYQDILSFYYQGAVIAPNYGRFETQMPEETNMNLGEVLSDRALIPFSNEHFAAFLLQLIGLPYWYGTCLYKCTNSLLTKKAKQYPSHYGSGRMPTYKEHIAAKLVAGDCIGAIKGYAWTNGGEGVVDAIGTDNSISSKYGSHGCPDKGTSGMFAHAKDKGMPWGTIDTLPEIIGAAVTFSGHVGYYLGNGKVFEFKSFASGSVVSDLADGKWTHWYFHPSLSYPEIQDGAVAHKYILGSRLLKNGSKGEDVRHLQRILKEMDYDLGTYGENRDGVDGSYGDKTVKAVKRLQTYAQIEADGKYGSITHKALMGILEDNKAAETPEEEITTPVMTKTVVVLADDVDVRSGPGETYKVLTRVDHGDALPYVATADGINWHAVELGGKIGWICGAAAGVIQPGEEG